MLTLTSNIKHFISHVFDIMHNAVDCLSIVHCTKHITVVVMALSYYVVDYTITVLSLKSDTTLSVSSVPSWLYCTKEVLEPLY